MSSKHASSHHPGYKFPTEDRISTLETKKGYTIYSVFDGHSGQQCVNLVSNTLPHRIVMALDKKESPSPQDISDILTEEFSKLEAECNDTLTIWSGGSTAVVSVVTDTHIITAHIGDSPAILFSKDGTLLHSTCDHDSKNSSEVARVTSEGGWFSDTNVYGENRLFNALAVTRSFGNLAKKSYEKGLNAIPDISIWERTPESYLILCSDSFTEKIIDSPKGDKDMYGNIEKIIANRGSHQDIINHIHPILVEQDYNIESTAHLAVHQQTMKFYNYQYGKFCGDNTSLILVDLNCVQNTNLETSISSESSNEHDNPESDAQNTSCETSCEKNL
jgi:serine/threonine protein phosphatase PrpC